MYTFDYTFYPKTFDIPEIDEFDNSMEWFIATLFKNGQILYNYHCVKLENKYVYRVVTPEKDSLEEKYWNSYCKEFYEDVVKKSRRKPKFNYIGEDYTVYNGCSCKNSSHYILLCEYAVETTPIICGDCHLAVPLYKFPKTYLNEEYYDLLMWQRVYESCDTLFTHGIGERFGYKMMHNPQSELSKEGMKFCKILEEKTKIPFYYYLFQYYRKNKKTCPLCGKDWTNDKLETIQFDFVCHSCRIVSNNIV